MKRIIILFLLFILFPISFSNWTGLTLQQRKEKTIQDKITYLYRKYPPNDKNWAYQITLNLLKHEK